MRLVWWALLALPILFVVPQLLPAPAPALPGQGNVLVVGAASGLGLETVKFLNTAGFTVFATFRSAGDDAALLKLLPRERVAQMDVLDAPSVKAAISALLRNDTLPLRAVVVSAGAFTGAPIELADDAALQRVLLTAVMGFVRSARETLPALRRGVGLYGRTTFIDFCSPSAYIAFPFWAAYVAGKAANAQLANVLRLELRGQGVDVVSMLPAMLRTRMVDAAIAETAQLDATWQRTRYAAAAAAFKRLFLGMHGPRSLSDAALIGPAVARAIESAAAPPYRLKVGNAPPLLFELIPQSWLDWLLDKAF